ncbi:MAG: hypothetical protein QW341_03510 [Candidatus Bathyarchaeia archaeon]
MRLEAFTDEHFPEIVIDREKEKITLKEYLKDMLKGRKRALYIHGPESWKDYCSQACSESI